MELAVGRLLREIDKIRIVDPHSHINPHAPTATGLADLLGYHYYTELAHSAGMPKSELESSGFELVERIAHYFPTMSNTVQYGWLVTLARRFFGFSDREITADNLLGLFDSVATAVA